MTFCVLLLLQYPFVFALERGNTDTVNVVFYTLAALLFVRGRSWFAGMAAGLAAGFKLSPVIAVIVMTGMLAAAQPPVARWTWLRYGGVPHRVRGDAAGVLRRRQADTWWTSSRTTPRR